MVRGDDARWERLEGVEEGWLVAQEQRVFICRTVGDPMLNPRSATEPVTRVVAATNNGLGHTISFSTRWFYQSVLVSKPHVPSTSRAYPRVTSIVLCDRPIRVTN